MMKYRDLFAAALIFVPPVAGAHHSHASIDSSRVETWDGVVVEYAWRSPHVYLRINAANPDDRLVEYSLDMLNPSAMSQLGWGPDSFMTGERVRWNGHPNHDPNRYYVSLNWIDKSDGTRMYGDRELAASAMTNSEPPSVTPAAAIGEGFWRRIAPDGSQFPFIRSPSADWPLNSRGATLVDNFDENDNPFNARCEYAGPPRAIFSVYGHVWSRPDPDTIYIWENLNPAPRVVHLNESAPRGEPSIPGHSVGYFDDSGALHVRTDNFVATQWGHYTGIDSSEQKVLSERYWLSENGMRLNVEVTVEDPVWLAEPYVFTHQWRKQPDAPVIDAECTSESANFYLTAGYEQDAVASGQPSADAADVRPPRRYLEWIFFGAMVMVALAIVTAGMRRRR